MRAVMLGGGRFPPRIPQAPTHRELMYQGMLHLPASGPRVGAERFKIPEWFRWVREQRSQLHFRRNQSQRKHPHTNAIFRQTQRWKLRGPSSSFVGMLQEGNNVIQEKGGKGK